MLAECCPFFFLDLIFIRLRLIGGGGVILDIPKLLIMVQNMQFCHANFLYNRTDYRAGVVSMQSAADWLSLQLKLAALVTIRARGL